MIVHFLVPAGNSTTDDAKDDAVARTSLFNGAEFRSQQEPNSRAINRDGLFLDEVPHGADRKFGEESQKEPSKHGTKTRNVHLTSLIAPRLYNYWKTINDQKRFLAMPKFC